MHEAANSVGLRHINAEAQFPHPRMQRRPRDLGAGDFSGLRRLGELRTCR